jgi:hypothetical protein
VLEEHPRAREPVDPGGRGIGAAVAAEGVGAQRVDRDEQDVEARLAADAGAALPEDGRERDQ